MLIKAHSAFGGSPEMALILHCARLRLSPDDTESMRTLLRNGLDWSRLNELAQRHAIQPLVYWHLKTLGADVVPSAMLAQLRARFSLNVMSALSLTQELLRLMECFTGHGVLALPFKGPVLATDIYGNPGLRPFLDLDFLVRKEDLPQITAILLAEGYWPQPRLIDAPAHKYLEYDRVHRFTHPKKRCVVEAHWKFTPRFYPFALDLAHLENRLASTRLGGREIKTLSPEDLLIVLCVHGSKHLWERLSWICDIAELARGCPDLNWNRVIQTAAAFGARRRLFLGLYLAGHLLNAPLPEAVSHQIHREKAVARLAERIRERLFDEGTDNWPDTFKKIPLHLATMERSTDKLRYCHYVRQIFRGIQKRKPLRQD